MNNPLNADREQGLDLKIPLYLIQPLLFEEERCPMAAVYTDFRNQGRRQVAAGVPLGMVLGPAEVELNLHFRNRTPNDPHTPAGWACEYMRLLQGLDIFVSLTATYTFARFMRCAIAPSAETYALLPEAMRPTPLQLLVKHHPGVDLALFPEMCDGLIYDMRDYTVAAHTFGYSVNWEHGLDEAIDFDPETVTMFVSEAFAGHVCDLHAGRLVAVLLTFSPSYKDAIAWLTRRRFPFPMR